MGFMRKLAGFLGLGREDDGGTGGDDSRQDAGGNAAAAAAASRDDDERRGSSVHRSAPRGFGVQIPVAVERPAPGPVVVACDPAEGHVQGFNWYTRRLRMDADGDVADEFMEELQREETVPSRSHTAMPRVQTKYNPAPLAKMRSQMISKDGYLLQSMEHQDRLQWV